MNKKVIISIIVVIAILLIAGGIYIFGQSKEASANDTNQENQAKTEECFIFEAGNKEIKINDEFAREKFGLECDYSEIQSCAFEGLDKTYQYGNYEITTYPEGSKEKILSIYFLDDTVSTKEGIKISDTYEQMVEKYSNNYVKEDNLYTYTKGNTNLKFIVEDGVITSIEYSLVTETK